MHDIEEIRKLFPVVRNWTFLNHAATSPMSLPAATAMIAWASSSAQNGGTQNPLWRAAVEETRSLASTLLGCSPGEIAFVQNTSAGVSQIAWGLPLEPGDNVVSNTAEYPANIYPWMALVEPKKIDLRLAREHPDGRIAADDIISACDDRTRVVAASMAQFATGYRMPLEEIGSFCAEEEIFFFVDAAQGLGVIDIDVSALGIDALASAALKWLLGPPGIAVLYCSRDKLKEIHPPVVGAASVVNPESFLDYDFTLAPDARRFESGNQNLAGILALKEAIQLLLDQGLREIEERALALTDLLCRGLDEKGYKVFSPRGEGEKSPIVSFLPKDVPAQVIVKDLADKRIVTSPRSGRIRVSPHFYNTETEIEALLDALP